jgi:hypothetical protein
MTLQRNGLKEKQEAGGGKQEAGQSDIVASASAALTIN